MAAPTISSISPTSAPAGTLIEITGTGFTEGTDWVHFGAVDAGLSYMVHSSTSISVVVPAGSGSVSVTVHTREPGGGTSNGVTFVYSAYTGSPSGGGPAPGDAPTVTGRDPTTSADEHGEGGDEVTITGTGFSTANAVYFGGTQAEFTINSDTSITAIAPPGSGEVHIVVSNAYGLSTETSSDTFTYPLIAAPVFTSMSPQTGFPGIFVTVIGSGFDYVTGVTFDTSFDCLFRIDSDTQITFWVPQGVTPGQTYNVWLWNAGGYSNDPGSANDFTVGYQTGLHTEQTGLTASPATNWQTGSTLVTLTAYNGGAAGEGVAATYYRVNGGAITLYTGAFNVTDAGINMVEYWSVSTTGQVEPVKTGYVNILSASVVPTGFSATAGIGFVMCKWSPVVMEGVVTYKLYWGTQNPPTDNVVPVGGFTHTVRIDASAGQNYYAVSSVDASGRESDKCTAVAATALDTAASLADGSISKAKLVTSIQPPIVVDSLPSLPDSNYPAGAYVFLTTNKLLYVTKTGAAGSWQPMLSGLDAVDVAYGDNLVPNSTSERDPTGHDTGWYGVEVEFRGVNNVLAYRGSRSRRLVGYDSGENYGALTDVTVRIPVVAGATYYCSSWQRVHTAVAAGKGGYLFIVGYDASGNAVDYPWSGTRYNSTTWTKDEFTYTPSASVVSMFIQVANGDSIGSSNYSYYDDIFLARQVGSADLPSGVITSTKIADDAITTPKLAANAVTAAEIAANTITAGQIATGAITADELAANSVFAKNVTILNFDNLVANPNSEASTSGKDTGPSSDDIEFRGVHSTAAYQGTYGRRLQGAGASTYSVIALTNYIAVTPGEDYYFEAMCRGSASLGTGYAFICTQCYDASFTYVGNAGNSSNYSSATWTKLSCSGAIPSGAYWMVPLLVTYNTSTSLYAWFDNLYLRRRADANLIVDGTITADKIAASTITSASACIASLNANWITTGVINASLITTGSLSCDRLSGGTITGQTIRTAGSGKRVQLTASQFDRIEWYTGSTDEVAAGSIWALGWSGGACVVFEGPDVDGGYTPSLVMQTATSGESAAQLTANTVLLGSGGPGDNPYGYAAARTSLNGAVTMGPSRLAGRYNQHEFLGSWAQYNAADGNAEYADEWYIMRLNAGGYSGSIDGASNHPGILSLTSGSSADSGMMMRQGYNTTYLNTSTTPPYDFDYSEYVFRIPYMTGGRFRMGWMSSANLWSAASPTTGDYGCYLYFNGSNIAGWVVINGTSYQTGTSYTPTTNTWYTGRVHVHQGGHVTFTIDAAGGQNLWSSTVNYCPTASPCGQGFIFWSTGSTPRNHLDIDYMNYFLAPRSR